MARKANPVRIGLFVLGAIALAVTGIVVLGSGRLFERTAPFVLYFSGSVNGLSIGAPVKFAGVEIGRVSDIRLQLDRVGKSTIVPVYIDIEDQRVMSRGGQVDLHDAATVVRMIDQGLRGQLQPQSLLTGLLFVQLEYQPQMPAQFFQPRDATPMEIPTVPTTLQQVQEVIEDVMARLQNIHIEQLVDALKTTATSITDLVTSQSVKAATDELAVTLRTANGALAEFRDGVAALKGEIRPLSTSLRTAAEQGGTALAEARGAIRNIEVLTAPSAPLAYQLTVALTNVAQAAESMRRLADYLERNPGALLYGREERRPEK